MADDLRTDIRCRRTRSGTVLVRRLPAVHASAQAARSDSMGTSSTGISTIMAPWRCYCGHYDDVHVDGTGPCRYKNYGSSDRVPTCTCRQFNGRGEDRPEGTDIYRKDEVLPGYHVAVIEKGVIGELSKVQEELDELKDAEAQGVKVMQLVEASDLLGALIRWLEAKHPGTKFEDLMEMHRVTRRAFENGRRR
jgi:hypothetical protein